jgi:hypothetical protein
MPGADMENEFQSLFSQTEGVEAGAPSSLKARLFSAFVRKQQESGRLASLQASIEDGHGICVFEKLVQIAPIGERAQSPFFCEVCHARVLAEAFDKPLIFWHHCPYVQFKKS